MGDGTAQSPSNYYESKHFDEEGRNAKKLCSFKTIHSSLTITENVTQWSSQFTMVNALASLMLSCVEVMELQTAFQNMTKFNQVTAALQRQGKYVKYFIMCLKTIPISKIALPLIHKLCMTIV